jgi:phosphoribosylformylglycinamidine synthase
MVRNLGFDITSSAEIRRDAFLFGEAQSRVVVSVTPANESKFVDFMIDKDIPFSTLGHVTKSELRIDDDSFGFIHDIKKVYEEALGKMVED